MKRITFRDVPTPVLKKWKMLQLLLKTNNLNLTQSGWRILDKVFDDILVDGNIDKYLD